MIHIHTLRHYQCVRLPCLYTQAYSQSLPPLLQVYTPLLQSSGEDGTEDGVVGSFDGNRKYPTSQKFGEKEETNYLCCI